MSLSSIFIMVVVLFSPVVKINAQSQFQPCVYNSQGNAINNPCGLLYPNSQTPPTQPVGTTPAEQPVGTTPSEQPVGTTPSGSASNSDGKIHNPLGATNSIPDLIKNALEDVLKICIPVVALAIIYCGFLFVFAMGNPEKLKKAKDALLYTVIGAAILLGALAIADIIVTTVQGL